MGVCTIGLKVWNKDGYGRREYVQREMYNLKLKQFLCQSCFTFQMNMNSSKCFSDGNVWPPGQRAETRERIASESLQKIRTKFYEVAGHVGRVKTVVTNHLHKMENCLEVVHTQGSRMQYSQDKLRSINWNQFLMLSQTFCLWGQATICWQQYNPAPRKIKLAISATVS